MQQTKTWTQEEDGGLRELRQQRGIKNWSQISLKMKLEFEMGSKTGKRCRQRRDFLQQRYFNYASSLVQRDEWSWEEQKTLFRLHNQKGNKWMLIAKQLQRHHNAVKNHYHSKIRTSLRKINTLIYHYLRNEFKSIKNSILPKILLAAEEYYSQNDKQQNTIAKKCFDMKNKILSYLDEKNQIFNETQIDQLRDLVKQANYFNKTLKKRKQNKNHSKSVRCNQYKGKQILRLIQQNKKNSWQHIMANDKEPSQVFNSGQKEQFIVSKEIYDVDQSIDNRKKSEVINQSLQRFPSLKNQISQSFIHSMHSNYSYQIPIQLMFANPYIHYQNYSYNGLMNYGGFNAPTTLSHYRQM